MRLYLIVGIFLFSKIAFGQDSLSSKIEKLNVVLASCEPQLKEVKYEISFSVSKEVLSIAEIDQGTIRYNCDMLIRDIHPEGIYLTRNESNNWRLKIVSLKNGEVFIEEKFPSGLRTSRTTNYVEVGNWLNQDEEELVIFIDGLRDFVYSFTDKKIKEPEEIEIVVPKN